jgi:sugar lactone lactonase YvrE
MKKLIGILLLAVLGYLLFWPIPIEPRAWTPPPAPKLEGVYAKNDRLKAITHLAEVLGKGPEGLSVDAAGHVYAGFGDGTVRRLNADGSDGIELASTGGRPLGTAVLATGEVIVADAKRGLLSIKDKKVKVLADELDGQKLMFVDDVGVTSDGGTMYFSVASRKFNDTLGHEDVIEHAPTGRVLAYDAASGKTREVMKDMYFPNGVTVGPDDAFILVNETETYRVMRYWLKGDKAGTFDVFADNLPGFPDNIKFNGRDRFWCAIFSPRSPDLDKLLPMPFLRKVVFRLPASLQPQPKKHAFALGFNVDGRLVANLQYEAPEAYAPITSVVESGEWLYFGSLTAPGIGRMPLAKALAP